MVHKNLERPETSLTPFDFLSETEDTIMLKGRIPPPR